MSFSFYNLYTKKIDKDVRSWDWRPTVAIIESLDILDHETIELISGSCLWGQITGDQARAIASGIEREYLPRMKDGARVTMTLDITEEPDDGTFWKGDQVLRNYSARKEWLLEFCDYCRKTEGFAVG